MKNSDKDRCQEILTFKAVSGNNSSVVFGLFKGQPMPSPLRNIAIITNTLYTIVVFFSIYYIFISRFVDILREMEIPWNWCCQWKQSTHV